MSRNSLGREPSTHSTSSTGCAAVLALLRPRREPKKSSRKVVWQREHYNRGACGGLVRGKAKCVMRPDGSKPCSRKHQASEPEELVGAKLAAGLQTWAARVGECAMRRHTIIA